MRLLEREEKASESRSDTPTVHLSPLNPVNKRGLLQTYAWHLTDMCAHSRSRVMGAGDTLSGRDEEFVPNSYRELLKSADEASCAHEGVSEVVDVGPLSLSCSAFSTCMRLFSLRVITSHGVRVYDQVDVSSLTPCHVSMTTQDFGRLLTSIDMSQ